MNEKMSVILGTLGTILFGVLASILAWYLGGKSLAGSKKEAIRQMFNFELTVLIIGIVTCWIPIIGQLICLVIWIANIVFAIKSFIAADKDAEFKAPGFNLIK